MKPLTRHTLHLTPLSPLHLGTGEDYEPTNYLITDGVLYTFDPARAILNPGKSGNCMLPPKAAICNTSSATSANTLRPMLPSPPMPPPSAKTSRTNTRKK